MKKTIAICVIAATTQLLSFSAIGQQKEETPKQKIDMNLYFPGGKDSSLTPERMKEALDTSEQVTKQILDNTKKGVEEASKIPEIGRLKSTFDAIANETMSADRDKTLQFLGLDPEGSSGVYIFVSWSMPKEMLRSYVIEAMWSGATLVFRGVPPGIPLATFLTQNLRELVYNKGSSANISIDPRLYDAFGVTKVPTIVFATDRSNFDCKGYQYVEFKAETGDTLRYEACPPMDSAKFDKMEGAVTLKYALDTFIENGSKKAVPFRNALSKGLFEDKVNVAKEQVPFVGKWDDVLTPEEKATLKGLTSELLNKAPPKAVPLN